MKKKSSLMNITVNKDFECPNCGTEMFLEEKNSDYKGETYDKWACTECTHIIVLDHRNDDEEVCQNCGDELSEEEIKEGEDSCFPCLKGNR